MPGASEGPVWLQRPSMPVEDPQLRRDLESQGRSSKRGWPPTCQGSWLLLLRLSSEGVK